MNKLGSGGSAQSLTQCSWVPAGPARLQGGGSWDLPCLPSQLTYSQLGALVIELALGPQRKFSGLQFAHL